VRLVGSALLAVSGDVGLATTDLARGNHFVDDGDVFNIEGDVLNVNEFNACTDTVCRDVAGNVALATTLAEGVHIGPGSPLRDAGVDLLAHGAPPSVVADFHGDCHFVDGSPDIGAEEAP